MNTRTLVVHTRDETTFTYPGDHTYQQAGTSGPFKSDTLNILDGQGNTVATFQAVFWSAVGYEGGEAK